MHPWATTRRVVAARVEKKTVEAWVAWVAVVEAWRIWVVVVVVLQDWRVAVEADRVEVSRVRRVTTSWGVRRPAWVIRRRLEETGTSGPRGKAGLAG
jgi:hypothetical protein